MADDDLILDIGPQTAHIVAALMKEAKTIIWNGPLGVFEFDQFGEGSRYQSGETLGTRSATTC